MWYSWQPLVVFALLLFAIVGCQEEPAPRPESPRPVVVRRLSVSNPSDGLRLTGVATAWAEEDIAFEVSGRVSFIVESGSYLRGHWEEGGQVTVEGDVIARLDPEQYEAQKRAAEADVASAKANFESVLPAQEKEAEANQLSNAKELEKIEEIIKRGGSVTDVELIQTRAKHDASKARVEQIQAQKLAAKASLDAAQASLSQAELNLKRTVLRAPFNGEVSTRLVDAGGFAQAATPVVHMVMMDPIKVTVSVSQPTHQQITVGEPVMIFPSGGGDPIQASVYEKAVVADASTRTFDITLILRNLEVIKNPPSDSSVLKLPRITRLMPAGAGLLEDGTIMVPERRTMRKDDQGFFVWRIKGINMPDDVDPTRLVYEVEKVRVTPGERRENYQNIFVLRELSDFGDLKPGHALVVDAPLGLKDGDKVAMIREDRSLYPGGLVDVQFRSHAAPAGYYLPIQAVALSDDEPDRGSIMVLDSNGNADAATGKAKVIEVLITGTVKGQHRIEPLEKESSLAGERVVIEGLQFIREGESVIELAREER